LALPFGLANLFHNSTGEIGAFVFFIVWIVYVVYRCWFNLLVPSLLRGEVFEGLRTYRLQMLYSQSAVVGAIAAAPIAIRTWASVT
jgi:hypothetical protein